MHYKISEKQRDKTKNIDKTNSITLNYLIVIIYHNYAVFNIKYLLLIFVLSTKKIDYHLSIFNSYYADLDVNKGN